MKKNKILFLIPTLVGGGAERVLMNLLNKIDTNKFQIDLVVVMKNGDFWNEIPQEIHTEVLFKSPLVAKIFNKLHAKYNINKLYRYFVQKKIRQHYDVGISFSDGSYTDILFFLQDKIKWKVSWIHSCYNSYQAVKLSYTINYRKLIIESRCKKLDEMIFVSQNARKEYIDIFGEYSNMQVIHNIIDKKKVITKSQEIIPDFFDPDKINLIAVGNLLPVKGYDLLIEVAKILKDKGYSFTIRILGKGYLKKELINKIHKAGVSNYVEIIGFKTNPYPYLAKSDIYVMPSQSEAFPMSLIEAMTLGLPVVTTDCSGCMEVSDNGNYGLISSQSSVDFADKVEMFIVNKMQREYYATLSLQRANQFDERKTMQQIYGILEKQR